LKESGFEKYKTEVIFERRVNVCIDDDLLFQAMPFLCLPYRTSLTIEVKENNELKVVENNEKTIAKTFYKDEQLKLIFNIDVNGIYNGHLENFNEHEILTTGFEGRGIGPRLVSGEYLGSTMYAAASAEIEFPIPALPESYGLSGAVWADAAWIDGTPGTGSGTLDPASQDTPLRTSVGASLIWDSPFGPLRGDVSHVLNKSTADRTQVFQITLQTLL
jgi:hypothetical protein